MHWCFALLNGHRQPRTAKLARVVKALQTLPRVLADVDVTKDGLEVRIVVDEMVFHKVKIGSGDSRWAKLKSQFTDLKIAEDGDTAYIYGRRSRVCELRRMLDKEQGTKPQAEQPSPRKDEP